MIMFRSLLCCCGSDVRRKHELLQSDYDYIQDEDLLLPGELQWDKVSKSFKKSVNLKNGGTGYVPPSVPSDEGRELPRIEDFRLLKTVGKGAFGKVSLSSCFNESMIPRWHLFI